MALQEFADGAFGNADEDAVEELQDIGEHRAVAPISRGQKMRRFVEDEKAIEAAILDEDTVAGDIGEAADPRIVEAGDDFEGRDRPVEGAENRGDQCFGLVDAEDAMAGGETREESVLPAAQGVSIILLGAVRQQWRYRSIAKDKFRTPSLHGPTIRTSENGPADAELFMVNKPLAAHAAALESGAKLPVTASVASFILGRREEPR
jgi:hypothetical protein